jgi:SAM-dependent methyltransferase
MRLDEYARMARVQERHWWYRCTRKLLGRMILPGLVEGGLFLDAGAGTGATGDWLADHGRLVALDFESRALRMHEAGGILPVQGSVADLPFADCGFDLVLCVTVLCHRSIEDPSSVVKEFCRVVKPGGLVCLMEPGVRRLRRAHDNITHTGRRFSRRDIGRLLTGAGLDLVRLTGAYAFLIPPAALKSLVEGKDSEKSDLDNPQTLLGLLPLLAEAEQRILRCISIPAGLSVLGLGRKSKPKAD